jgi:hypothetical protein
MFGGRRPDGPALVEDEGITCMQNHADEMMDSNWVAIVADLVVSW